jgi:hypothetical protein
MLKLWTVPIPIETRARWFSFYFYGFRLGVYNLLTGYTCTRAHPFYVQHSSLDWITVSHKMGGRLMYRLQRRAREDSRRYSERVKEKKTESRTPDQIDEDLSESESS